MPVFDHVRRGVTVLLVAALLLVAPQIAAAQFSRSQSASVAVAVAELPGADQLEGTYQCTGSWFREGVSVQARFGGAFAAGGSYTYRLSKLDGSSARTVRTSQTELTITAEDGIDFGVTRWLLTVDSTLGNWVGPTISKTITCSTGNGSSGSL